MAENWLRKTSELLPLRFASWVVSEEVRPLPKPAQSQQQETPRSRRGNCPGRARGTGSPPRQQESGAALLGAFRDPLSGEEERGTASSTLGPSNDFLLHARAALARASTLPALLGRCLQAPDSEVTRRSRTTAASALRISPGARRGRVLSQLLGRRWPQHFPRNQQGISRSCILLLPDSFTEESVFTAKSSFALVMYGFQQNSWNLLFTSRGRGYRNTSHLQVSDTPAGFLLMCSV